MIFNIDNFKTFRNIKYQPNTASIMGNCSILIDINGNKIFLTNVYCNIHKKFWLKNRI